MKNSSPPAKRGWRGLVLAVLLLVIFSLLVPLVFLFGFINGPAYETEARSNSDGSFSNYEKGTRPRGKKHQQQIEHLIDQLMPEHPEGIRTSFEESTPNDAGEGSTNTSNEGKPVPSVISLPAPVPSEDEQSSVSKETASLKREAHEETGKSCQLEFGNYCVWCEENKEEMVDSTVKKMKDQLFLARAYYPSIAKLPSYDELTRELKMNIQEYEHIFSEGTTDADLPHDVDTKIERMGSVIRKTKAVPVDCTNVEKKFRQLLDLTEDEAHFHRKQSAFLYQLAVQTIPKSHHCLTMRLTVEYFRTSSQLSSSSNQWHAQKNSDPSFHHIVIFSRNILASSVVVNSTLMHAKEPEKLVFHLVTDKLNYYAMSFWFSRNVYKNATIDVLNIEEFTLKNHGFSSLNNLSPSEEFRVSVRSDNATSLKIKTNYISVFGHSQFLLPEIFPNLEKVVVLDDDVLVQQDLSHLWSIDLKGKVNGAIEFCGLKFGNLKKYFGKRSFNESSCAWMSGLNMIDLKKWREVKLTKTYKKLLQIQQKQSQSETFWRSICLPVSFLTFQSHVHPLDDSLAVVGLGHDYGIDDQILNKAAVLHYNGNMKPWLELGIPKYKKYWSQYLNRMDRFMDECNVNVKL